MIPSVSAGSNHVGASETWIAQVNWPPGAAASATPGEAAASPRAVSARTSRRVRSDCFEPPFRLLLRRAILFLHMAASSGGLAANLDHPHKNVSTFRVGCRRSRGFDRDVLVGRGIGKVGNQAEPGFSDPRPRAVDERELPDRSDDGFLVHELLHLFQDRRAPFVIELGGLLR